MKFLKSKKSEKKNFLLKQKTILSLAVLLVTVVSLYSCKNKPSAGENAEVPKLPVLQLEPTNETLGLEYPASIQAVSNVEIRPQVDGILDKIYVDEGVKVTKGQLLFKINDRPYVEKLNQAKANLASAKAALYKAQQEMDKKQSLVANKVVTDFQLRTAKSERDAALANVSQAAAAVESAKINVGYTLIRASTTGYIGKLEKKEGSLVGTSDQQALTTLSNNSNLHVYFALSENDYMILRNSAKGSTMEEKIKNIPPVKLVLSNDSVYEQTGKIDMVNGQFETNTASIELRATFSNPTGFLRNGNTGKIQIPTSYNQVITVPQSATMEMQGKVFVFKLGNGNKITQQVIEIIGKTGSKYIIKSGVNKGDIIVTKGIDLLKDGQAITPIQPTSK